MTRVFLRVYNGENSGVTVCTTVRTVVYNSGVYPVTRRRVLPFSRVIPG